MRYGRFLSENKWFLLGLCFLVLNGGGVAWLAGRARITTDCVDKITETQINEPLQLTCARQYTSFPDGGIGLLLEWNKVVSMNSLVSYLTLTSHTGQAVAWTNAGRSLNQTLMIKTAPTDAQSLALHITPGVLRMDEGPGLIESIELKVPCSHSVQLVKINASSMSFEDGRMVCEFSLPIHIEKALPYISIEPAVDIVMAHASSYWQRNRYQISGAFQPGQAYMVTFKAGLPGVVGGRLTNTIVRPVLFPDRPAAVAVDRGGVYLSASSEKLIPVKMVNVTSVHVVVRNVFENNLVPLAMRQTGHYHGFWGDDYDGLGRIIDERDYGVTARRNEMIKTGLSMEELVASNGTYSVEISAPSCGRHRQLVVLTDLGLTVKRSSRDMLVWLNRLQSLDAVSGAEVHVYSQDNQELAGGVTDEAGMLYLKGLFEGADIPFLVTARKGEDMTYIVLDGSGVELSNTKGRAWRENGYEAFLFTERGVYRPAETAHVAAVIREVDRQSGAVSSNGFYVCPPSFPVELVMTTPQGKEQNVGKEISDAYGTVTFDVAWAKSEPTGIYRFSLRIPGSKHELGATQVAVEDFAPPTIAVRLFPACSNLTATSSCPLLVQGDRLCGVPADGNRVDAQVLYEAHGFKHPDWDAYDFTDELKSFSPSTCKLESKALDENGQCQYDVSAPVCNSPPSRIHAIFQATVHEFGGRTVSSRAVIPVDMYPFYIGIRQADAGVNALQGRSSEFDVVAVTPEGDCIMGSHTLSVNLFRMEWASVMKKNGDGYAWESEKRAVPVSRDQVTLTNGQGVYRHTFLRSGTHVLQIADEESGVSAALEVNVAGLDTDWIAWGGERPEQIEMTWDKPSYKPGDTALLQVVAPFAGKALMTLESDHILKSELIDFSGNAREIPIAVTAAYWPNVHCAIIMIKPLVTNDPCGVYRAVGRVPLPVTLSNTHLQVTLNVPPQIRPESDVMITGALLHADGTPAEGDVFVMAVDEAICMLTGFKLPEPNNYFAALRMASVLQYDVYARLMPIWSSNVLAQVSSTGGDASSPLSSRLNPIDAQRFKPVSLWGGLRAVDEKGDFEWKVHVPEFTGKLRVMAVAVDSNAWGAARESIVVRRPFDVQYGLPRFLAPDDRCVMPVRINTREGWTNRIDITMFCDSPLCFKEDGTQSMQWTYDCMSPEESSETGVHLLAGDVPGKAVITIVAESGGEVYREVIELPVRPPYGYTTKRGSGQIAAGKDVRIALPDQWVNGTEEGFITCCGLPEMMCAGALDYLLNYPYGCVEQTTSKAFPLLSMAEHAGVVNAGNGQDESVELLITKGIWRLASMQQVSGGFAYWPDAAMVYPWGSVYASHFLVEAKRRGFDVPGYVLDNALHYVEEILRNPGRNAELDSLRLYACYVLACAEKPVGEWLSFFQQQRGLSQEGKLYLAAALAQLGRNKEARTLLDNPIASVPLLDMERISGALSSQVRLWAFELLTWVQVEPGNGAVPVLVQKLLKVCENGCWATTQDNAMALMALSRYYESFSSQSLDFQAELVCDSRSLPFDRFSSNVVVSYKGKMPSRVTVSNEGPGPVYYYWSSSGVPQADDAGDLSHGIHIQRNLFDPYGYPVDMTSLQRGDLVVVEWRLKTDAVLNDLVIEDLLPACFEIEQAGLVTSAQIPWMKRHMNMPLRHVDVRDDRVVAFTDVVCGDYKWCYVVRVVTDGIFTYPAIKAEAMYEPGFMGRSGFGQIDIPGRQ